MFNVTYSTDWKTFTIFLGVAKKKGCTKNKKTLDIFYCSVQYPVPLLGFKYSETSLQRAPSGPQNSVRYRGVRLREVFPKLAYFNSKTYSRVLGYSVIETKVCQKVGGGSRKSLKTIY